MSQHLSDAQLLAGDWSRIVFTEDPHGYTHPDHAGLLQSITDFIKTEFKRPFDEADAARRKSAELFVPVEAILLMWKEKRERAAAHGTALHEFIRRWLLKLIGYEVLDGFAVGTPSSYAVQAFVDYFEDKLADMIPEAVEEPICYLPLGFCGTPDVRFLGPNRRRYVVDWKSNAELTVRNYFGYCLKPPFNDLDDCDLNLYALQVAMYRLILEWAGYPTHGGIIVHIPCDGSPAKAYQLTGDLDLRQRLREYFKPIPFHLRVQRIKQTTNE